MDDIGHCDKENGKKLFLAIYPSALGLDEYLKDIEEMPSAVLDLFEEEELGEEIDLTSRAPPDFEDFIRLDH